MNVNTLKSKKSLKLVTLIIASLLIATVSAEVYYSLTVTSTISVASTDVYFMPGSDSASAGAAMGSADNTTITFSNLKAYPGVTTTYAQAAIVRNNATAASYQIRMRPVSLTGAATNFAFVNFTLVEGSTTIASLNYTSDTSSWTIPSETSFTSITANTNWSLVVETQAVAGATSDSVTIVLTIDVQ
jgi:hypothetical protein